MMMWKDESDAVEWCLERMPEVATASRSRQEAETDSSAKGLPKCV